VIIALDLTNFKIEEVISLMEEDADEDEGKKSNSTQVPHNIYWYTALRSAEKFHEKFHRYPGQFPGHDDEKLEADVQKLQECAKELVASWDMDPSQVIIADTLREL
jgi:hypothetical protein